MLMGGACVNAPRAWVISRVAPTKSAPASKSVLSDCNSPNNRNAMITDRMVSMVRVFLRNRLAMTNPVRVMSVAPSGRGLFQQLPLLQVQRPAREFRGLGVVRDHHDGLAVLAVQHLQKAEDLIRRL